MDVHTEYATDYIKQCVDVLEQTGADNVGGPWHAVGKHYLQQAIALAFQSPFSSGGAGSHSITYEGFVDSVYLGCWRKETLEKLGMFDEDLARNQDDELNLRIIRSGGRIWQSPKIMSWYYPRASIKTLFKQYMQYGYWKVRVIRKHKIPASIRHLVPGGFVATVIILLVLSLFSHMAAISLLILLGLYGTVNFVASLVTCSKLGCWKFMPVMPLVFLAYHAGYGLGFLRGVLDFMLLGKRGHSSLSNITRVN
jgi:GT2 family glycosyltransferase